ncbi:MAG: aldolase/citrate lyase family protein [Myxococcota bacterium]
MSDLLAIRRHIQGLVRKHRARPEPMRGMYAPYFRRGVMAIPAFRMKGEGDVEEVGRVQSLRVMKKATTLPVDCFFYDLEDAAPDHPGYKVHARSFVVEALRRYDFGRRVVAFRPNNIRTPYFEDDLVEVLTHVGDRLHALVIPKTEYAEEIADIESIVRDIQRLAGHSNEIALEVLIESPRALLEAEKIAACPTVSSLTLGSWDFARTIGGQVRDRGWLQEQSVVRQQLPIIAAAYGKEAIDAVTVQLPLRPQRPSGMNEADYTHALNTGVAGFTPEQHAALASIDEGVSFVQALQRREEAIALAARDALDAHVLGYAGKWVLHPDQIEPIQSAFSPTREESLKALALIARYARAARAGSGAEVDRDRLADKAVIGAEWWKVKGGIQAGVLTDKDIEQTGLSWQELQRTAVSYDGHSSLG